MTEPRTAAGRTLMDAVTVDPKGAEFGVAITLHSIVRHAVPRIEAEARAAALDEARAAVDGMPPDVGYRRRVYSRRRILAAIDALRETLRRTLTEADRIRNIEDDITGPDR